MYVCDYFFEDITAPHASDAYVGGRIVWELHPESRERVWVPFTCTRHMHVVTYERTLAHMCMCVRARARYTVSVLVHVYSAPYYVTPCIGVNGPDVCTERADDSPTSVCTHTR